MKTRKLMARFGAVLFLLLTLCPGAVARDSREIDIDDLDWGSRSRESRPRTSDRRAAEEMIEDELDENSETQNRIFFNETEGDARARNERDSIRIRREDVIKDDEPKRDYERRRARVDDDEFSLGFDFVFGTLKIDENSNGAQAHYKDRAPVGRGDFRLDYTDWGDFSFSADFGIGVTSKFDDDYQITSRAFSHKNFRTDADINAMIGYSLIQIGRVFDLRWLAGVTAGFQSRTHSVEEFQVKHFSIPKDYEDIDDDVWLPEDAGYAGWILGGRSTLRLGGFVAKAELRYKFISIEHDLDHIPRIRGADSRYTPEDATTKGRTSDLRLMLGWRSDVETLFTIRIIRELDKGGNTFPVFYRTTSTANPSASDVEVITTPRKYQTFIAYGLSVVIPF
ncbi:MAG: hypothetical protein NUW37_03765 [Planctomycetes bacterium]|nr:hypothetical protein [Planctomycetota bacterium]